MFIHVLKLFAIALLFFSNVVFAEPNFSANAVRFAQMSDVHLSESSTVRGGRMRRDSEKLFADAIEQVNEQEKLDFVVFTGDMVDVPYKKIFENFINMANGLNPPWYWAIGNHDVSPDFSKQDLLRLFSENSKSAQCKTYYSFKIKDFLFIVMDGTIEVEISANGYFSDESLEWLDRELTENMDLYAVIFQHYPLVEPFGSLSHRTINYKKYLTILDKHDNVAAVVSGHYHGTRVQLRKNVAHISTPSLVQFPNAFRVITAEKAGDKVFLKLEFIPTRLKEISEESRGLMKNPDLHAGKDEDRSGIIKLHKPLPATFKD